MHAAFSALIAALLMSGIVAVRYVLTSGGFALATRTRHPGLYQGKRGQIAREVGWSLAAAVIYGLPAGVVAWGWQHRGWTLIYTDAHAFPLWWMPASLLLYLLVHDTWFYWTHRAMHVPSLFKLMHAVHHASRPPTAWAAMSFHPWESLTGAIVIPLLVFLIPIHVAVLAVVLTIMTIMGVTNHMGWEMFPRFVVHGAAGKWLITATHHDRHHRDYRCNYGLYFRHWDRLCGTDRGFADFDQPIRARSI